MRNWYKTINSYTTKEYFDEPEEWPTCPYCRGTGSVDAGPYAPRPVMCEDCLGTGRPIKFQTNEEVIIDSPDYGELTGYIDEAYYYDDNNYEWIYKVYVDELTEVIEVGESDMRLV